MNLSLPLVSGKCEVRAVIRVLTVKNYSMRAVYRELCEMYSDNVMFKCMAHLWVERFMSGQHNMHNEERSGCPCDATSSDLRPNNTID